MTQTAKPIDRKRCKNRQSAIGNRQSAIGNRQSAIGNTPPVPDFLRRPAHIRFCQNATAAATSIIPAQAGGNQAGDSFAIFYRKKQMELFSALDNALSQKGKTH